MIQLLADVNVEGHLARLVSRMPHAAAREGELACRQLVEYAPQAEQVGAMIDLPAGLLGGHVEGRPQHHADLGYPAVAFPSATCRPSRTTSPTAIMGSWRSRVSRLSPSSSGMAR